MINLFKGLLKGFIVPSLLSINKYSDFKTFSLFTSFAGFTHLGIVDGIFIKYGGSRIKDIPENSISTEFYFFIYIQLIIFIPIIFFSSIFQNIFILALSLNFFGCNLVAFFSYLSQATGNFKIFKTYNLVSSSISVSLLIAAYIYKIDQLYFFIFIEVIMRYIESFIIYRKLKIRFLKKNISVLFLKDNWILSKKGFVFYLGNLSSVFFYSLDRWFVKIALSKTDFAIYSFAVSMLNLIMVVIISVSMSLYPKIVKGIKNKEMIVKLKKLVLILGVFSCSGYFILKFGVSNFLFEYLPSLNIISILFLGVPSIAVINSIYINLYKAMKNERKYIYTVLFMLSISFVLNLIAFIIKKSNTSIACATTISFYFWFIFSIKDFISLRITMREIFYIICFIFIFIYTSNNFSWYIGLIIYLGSMFVTTYFLFKNELNEIIKKTFDFKM